jgi:phage FluMu protein Com
MNNEVRCPKCSKLLFKAEGFGARIEIQCDRCKSVVIWPVLVPEIKQPEVKLSTRKRA